MEEGCARGQEAPTAALAVERKYKDSRINESVNEKCFQSNKYLINILFKLETLLQMILKRQK